MGEPAPFTEPQYLTKYIDLGLDALEDYLDVLDSELPNLLQAKRDEQVARTQQFNSGSNDEVKVNGEVYDGAVAWPWFMGIHFFPKIVWGTFILGVWSFFEGAVGLMAQDWHSLHLEAEDPAIALKDLDGNFLARARTFFRPQLYFPQGHEFRKLELIQRIRNIVIHADSRLSDSDLEYLDRHFERLAEFRLEKMEFGGEHYIKLGPRFCRWALNVVTIEVGKVMAAFRDPD